MHIFIFLSTFGKSCCGSLSGLVVYAIRRTRKCELCCVALGVAVRRAVVFFLLVSYYQLSTARDTFLTNFERISRIVTQKPKKCELSASKNESSSLGDFVS